MRPGSGGADISKSDDNLSGSSIELSPVRRRRGSGACVVVGRTTAFEDLTCGSADPIMVADHVDHLRDVRR